MKEKVGKLTVSVPEGLMAAIEKIARERNTSRSKVVAECLQKLAEERFRTEMEEGYRVMAGELQETAAMALETQRRVVPEWE